LIHIQQKTSPPNHTDRGNHASASSASSAPAPTATGEAPDEDWLYRDSDLSLEDLREAALGTVH
jgi:hypothetical protein